MRMHAGNHVLHNKKCDMPLVKSRIGISPVTLHLPF